MPDPHFGEVSQAEDVSEAKCIHLLALKLVRLVALFQGQSPGVAILSKNDYPHIGISAGS